MPNHADSLKKFDHYYAPVNRHVQSLAKEFDSYEKAYHGESEISSKPSGEDESWKSYVLHRYALQQTQVLSAEVVPEADPGFSWDTKDEGKHEYARIVEAVVSDQLNADDYSAKKYESVLKAAVYKSCPVKVSWETRIGRTVEISPDGPKVVRKIVVDRPTATLIEPRDFGVDLRARSLDKARFAYHRMRLSIEEIEAAKRSDGTPLYDNLDDLRSWFDAQDQSDTSQSFDNDVSGELALERAKGIEVIEMFTHDRVMVRAAGKYMIRDEERVDPIVGLPFAMITLIPSLNDVYGMSLMQILRDPQEHLWTLDNGALNGLKLMLDPPRAVDVISDPDNADRAWKPGQVYPTSMAAKDAVEILRVQGIDPLVSQNAVSQQRELMEYISGITRDLAGQSDAGTATQAALNQRQSKGRIGKMITSVNRGWAQVAAMFLALDQVFLDYSRPVKLLGPRGAEWQAVTPSMIGGDWQPTPKATSEDAVKELTKQNLLEFFTATQPLTGAVSPTGKAIDWSPLVKKLAELDGLEPEEVIVDAQQLFEAQHAQTVAQAKSDAEAQQILAPPPPPQDAPVDPQVRLFESVNYKDLPGDAQAAMLEGLGLPSAGVSGPTDPTMPPPPKPETPVAAAK